MKTLNQIRCGKSAVIIDIKSQGAIRQRLLDMGLTPKTTVTIKKVAPLGDPIEIFIRSYDLTLRLDEAKNILVSEVSE